MTATQPALVSRTTARADRVLKGTAIAWTVAAVGGQLLFAYYIAALYGGIVRRGDPQGWNTVMTHGYVPADPIGNVAVVMHVAMAFLLIIGGAIQLVPQIRRRAPVLHRWNGRIYLSAAVSISLGGLYMLWVRGTVGDLWQHLATTLNGLLILWFASQALRTARASQFGAHQRWALRLFLASGGVWFFRIGLTLWLMVNQGPVGFDGKTFTGPALTFLGFSQTLLPLAVLEVYLAAKSRAPTVGKLTMAATLAVLTVGTIAGTATAYLMLWRPRL